MNTDNHDGPDTADRPGFQRDVLVEHSDTSNREFDRRESTSFSAEDRVALKHVAGVLGALVAVALTLGLIARIA